MSTEAKNLKQVDEVELAFRLMESDESVLAEILVNFGSSVIALIGKKYATLRHEDAEDVFSIALNKLWKNRQNYDDSKGKLRSYLFSCLLYTSPSPRDRTRSRMPSSA